MLLFILFVLIYFHNFLCFSNKNIISSAKNNNGHYYYENIKIYEFNNFNNFNNNTTIFIGNNNNECVKNKIQNKRNFTDHPILVLVENNPSFPKEKKNDMICHVMYHVL